MTHEYWEFVLFFLVQEANLREENNRLVRRMEKIHFRPWEKGILGKDLKIPFPSAKNTVES